MDIVRQRAGLLVALALWLVPRTAGADARCALVLGELNATVEPGVFLEKDRELIELWYQSADLGPHELAEKVFRLYLERRLALLTPEQADQVRRILEKRTSILDVKEDWEELDWENAGGPGMLGSRYSITEQWIQIWTHPQYKSSEVHFHILAHEAEHAIQDVVLRNRGIPRGQPASLGRRWFDRQGLLYEAFLVERQAMTAEWAFSRAIPEKRRKELLALVERDTTITPQERRSLARWLANASLPLKEYLEKEYQDGRYPPPPVRNRRVRQALDRILATGSTSALATLLAIAIAEGQCAQVFQDAGDEYFGGLCERFQ